MKLVKKIQVVNKNWRIYLWDPEEFHNKFYKEFGGVYGLTHFHRRAIDLPMSSSVEDIRHEIWHAYSYELCLHSTHGMLKKQWDEVMCDFFAMYGDVYLKQCKQIGRDFNKIKRKWARCT